MKEAAPGDEPPVRPLTATGLAALGGLLLALSAPRHGLWPLAWLSFVPLLFALRGRRFWKGLAVGLVFGTTATTVLMGWIPELLSRFAGLSPPLAFGALLAAALVHGLGLAVAAALTCWLWRRGMQPVAALPLGLTAGELLAPMVFPWQVAISQHEVLGLIQVADLVGSRGVSALVALGGAALFQLVAGSPRRDFRRGAAAGLAVVGAACLYGAVRIAQVEARRSRAPSLSVGLLQPSLSIEEKGDRQLAQVNLTLQQEMSADAEERGAQVVIWPETAYPYPIPRGLEGDMPGERALRVGFDIPVIFGAISVDRARRQRFNSAFLLDRTGRLSDPADKNELLVFAEHIPFYEEVEALQRAFPQSWAFTSGEGPGILEVDELRAGILNCYEDIVPPAARAVARRGPNLLVNVTNDAWFGDSAAPHQHAALARFRAVEHRVDLVRAVNSGISTVVSATGEEVDRTRAFERVVVVRRVRLLEAGSLYTALGDAWAWLAVAAIPLLGLWMGRRKRLGQ